MTILNFKKKFSLEKRKEESEKIKTKYPNRYPIIVNKSHTSKLENIDKSKFLAPGDLTMGQFQYVVRKRITLKEEESLFLFINDKILINGSENLAKIYDQYKDEDGFLYITYCGENVFGN